MNDLQKIDALMKHIEHVREACLKMGTKLIEAGQVDYGRKLIANSLIHDNSKFYGVEWDNLDPSVDISAEPNRKLKLNLAIQHHNRTNPHHPEYWGSIDKMPYLYLCEMLADWKARSVEFGTSLHDWIDVGAAARFKYTKGSMIHKQLVELAAMICDKPFEPVNNVDEIPPSTHAG